MNRRRIVLIVALAVIATIAFAVAAKGAADARREQWAKSAHARRVLTVNATIEARGTTAAHCGRCHSEQGFRAWLPQLLKGNVGPITQPDGSPATLPFLASLGLTRFSVRPQTCATCHNADYSLRLEGSTPLLPAGFRARRVGAGALCMSCHNTRNGAVTWNTPNPGRFTGPHTPAQADVIMGKNVYFVNFGENFISPHAAFTGDACVTCHVKLNPSSHTFRAQKTVCTNCHGPSFTAERVQRATEGLIEDLAEAINERAMTAKSRVATVGAWDPNTDQTTANSPIDPAQITGAVPTEFHGQMGLILKLTGGRDVSTLFADIKDGSGALVFPTTDVIVRASWNYFLFHGDGSKGVHNPRFYRTVILATLDALK
jgi:hypothetical protein